MMIRQFTEAVDNAALQTTPRGIEYDFNSMLEPVPLTAKFALPDFHVWCGSVVKGDDGKYHLFYSRWPRKLGFDAWVTHSEVAHAVGDTLMGPFFHKDLALSERGQGFWDGLCTHNPTVMRFGSRFYLYYMGNTGDRAETEGLNWTHRNSQRIGVALADSPDGPWLRFDRPLLEPTPGFHDALCCANPSVTERFGGGYLMVYKAVDDKGRLPFGGPVSHCVATSESPRGPFEKRPDRIFCKEGVFFPAEDPFIWRDDWRYWAIVKDYNGSFTGNGKSLALFESDDGFDWKPSGNVLVSTLQIRWADGNVQKLQMLERPQLYIEEGRPLVLLCAAMDTNGNTFNVQIPLEDGAAESREFGR